MSDQGGGFAPIGGQQPPQTSFEDDEKALKSGRGKMLVAMFVAVAAAIGGFAWYLSAGGENEYGPLGRQINAVDAQYFDRFWSCALPREDMAEISTNVELTAAIAERARTARVYSQHVRETCLPMLDEALPPMDALLAPDDMRAPLDRMRASLVALRAAYDGMARYLDQLTDPFDAEDADFRTAATAIARAWHDYKVAHNELNGIVRSHLEDE